MDSIVWPLRLGIPTKYGRFPNARIVLDAAHNRVGICNSDAGPVLVGPLDRAMVEQLIAEDRFRWLKEER